MGYNFLIQHRNWNGKNGKNIFVSSSIGPSSPGTTFQCAVSILSIPSTAEQSCTKRDHSIRTKSLKNEVGALCWPQQTLNQALLQSKDGFILQRDSSYQNHTKIHTVTQKNKWFLIKHTQIRITFFTQIFPLNHYWERRWGESLPPQNSHVLLFPWEILLREVL